MAQTTPTGAEVVARTLARAGVRRVFSLSGNQVLSLYESLDRAGVAIVHTRHEGAAVHMADAWARLTGEVGVCLVSAGPGHANALGALAVAGTGESAVLLLSGHAPLARAGQGAFQEMDQAGLARPLVRWAQVATSPAVLGAQVASALRAAQRGIPGPVHLSLPVDVLEAPAPAGPDAATDAAPDVGAGRAAEGEEAGEAAPPDGAAVRAVLDALSGAARPLILAGAAGGRPALHARLEALSARSGVPWLRVDHPRGLADPGLGRAAEAVAAADVLLLVGKRQDYRLGYAAPPVLASGVRLLQIDPEREAIGRHRPVEVAIVAGLLPALDALLAAAGDGVGGAGGARSGPAAWAARVAALRAAPSGDDPDAAGDGAPGGGLHPWAVLGVLAAALDARRLRGRDVCLVVDGGEFGQWARARLRPAPPGDLVNEPSGAIGYALPFAVAAALARPAATVVALAGDGAFGFYALELETAARCAAPVLVVVGNDAAWGTERHLQLRRYGADRAVATDLLPARYDVLATALGGHGEHVEALDALRPALERALDAVAAGRPAVVDVRLRSVPSPAAGAL